MQIGPGFWLNPATGEIWRVSRHEYWLMDSANQRAAKFSQDVIDALGKLDVASDADPIRLIGVKCGLVRVRDYGNRLSIQFFTPPEEVAVVLASVAAALPKLFSGAEHFLTLHNLHNDSRADVHSQDFLEKVRDGRAVMHGGR